MKKILCITLMALMAVAIAHAEGEDEPGNFGLGYQGIVLNGDSGPGLMNAIALRWAPQPIGGSLSLGQFASTAEVSGGSQEDTTTAWALQGKILWTLIDRANSDFYVGGLLGMAYYEDERTGSGNDYKREYASFIFGVLGGVEWRFAELPEIGFNFELGYNFETEEYEDNANVSDNLDTLFSGTSVTMGATYYF